MWKLTKLHLKNKNIIGLRSLKDPEFFRQNTEQVVKSYSRASSQPRDWPMSLASPKTGRWICYHYAAWEACHPQILGPTTLMNYMGAQPEACCTFYFKKTKDKWLDIASSEKEVQHFSQPLGMLEARYTSVQCMLLWSVDEESIRLLGMGPRLREGFGVGPGCNASALPLGFCDQRVDTVLLKESVAHEDAA